MTEINTSSSITRIPLETVVIHFAGDSGDGMQVAGMQFTQACASLGNDVRTFPDFPAEIRAPAGSLFGISGFQLSFSQQPIYTPGDCYDVLVAMNPAALKVAIKNLRLGGILIVDEDKFIAKDLAKAGFSDNPLPSLESSFKVFRVPMITLTLKALELMNLSRSEARKCKNLFALGVVCWLYHRALSPVQAWIKERFSEPLQQANLKALSAGYNYAITTELFAEHYTVEGATLTPGEYRQITGNQALALGCVAVAAGTKSLLVCGYPITPASDILHVLAKYSHFGITVFQAEDEIAAIGAAIGAAFGGKLALTATSGPGLDLKSEALGLAVMTELPLVVIDVQRAGPSTGMPTKVEQSDLLTALYGRHGECPIPVVAPATPGECFYLLIEAFRLAVKYMTPIILLSDAFLASSAELWKIPQPQALPDLKLSYWQSQQGFLPYQRDPATLARPWAIPGTPGLEHRIGGLEKQHLTGHISYDPENHQQMVNLRAAKVQNIQNDLPPIAIQGVMKGKLLVIGWGGTYGTIRTAVEQLQTYAIGVIHLRYLHPLAEQIAEIAKNFQQVVVVELNSGQLCQILRARFLIDAKSISKVAGKPFSVSELKEKLLAYLREP